MPSIALRCSAGTGDPLSVVHVNEDTEPFEISNDDFEGRLAVRIKDFHGEVPEGKDVLRTASSGYFDEHPKVTWSIQIQCRFKKPFDADQVVFGNIFSKPIRDHLPYGTSAALKFARYIDPSLEMDVYADNPWAWSPLIATMNTVHLTKGDALPQWRAQQPTEDVSAGLGDDAKGAALANAPDARRKFFSAPDKRKAVKLDPDVVLDADFCNGFINFDSLSLKLYAGFEIPLAKYWDGQPVTFVCRTRDGSSEFFRIEFTIVDQDIVEEKKRQGHEIHSATKETGHVPNDTQKAAESSPLPPPPAADPTDEEVGAPDKDPEGID